MRPLQSGMWITLQSSDWNHSSAGGKGEVVCDVKEGTWMLVVVRLVIHMQLNVTYWPFNTSTAATNNGKLSLVSFILFTCFSTKTRTALAVDRN